MKYLKLYEDLHQPSNAKKKFRLVQLGLSESGLKVLSVTVHWESLDDFADTKYKDHYVAKGPIFTLYDYDNWPVSDSHDGWQESIDDIWSDWKEWFGQEGDSDEIFDHLIREARNGRWDLLHLRNEGQFYDPYTREMVGTGSIQNPKLNESLDQDEYATSVEDAIEKFSKWNRLDRLGLAGRIKLAQIETQSEGTDPDLGFPAHIDSAKFREFKKFVKRFGVVHTNSYAGRSKDDRTINAHLWEMPYTSAQAFSNLPELEDSEFGTVKIYKEPADRIWYPWLREITDEGRVNESTSINQKLRLFRLGLMDPTRFEIGLINATVRGAKAADFQIGSSMARAHEKIYQEIKVRARELGAYLSSLSKYNHFNPEPVNYINFTCVGPVESLAILVPEIKAKLSELNRNDEIEIMVEADRPGLVSPLIKREWIKLVQDNRFDEGRVNESTSINHKLRLFRLGLMDPTDFEINTMSVVVDGPISQLRKGRLKYVTVIKGMYNEIKERARELGVYLTVFAPYSLRYIDGVNHVQFSCHGPVESLDILEPEINAMLSELNRNNEININVTNRSLYTGPGQTTQVFDNWAEWAKTNLSDI